jgi:hypothetical protein
MTVSHRRVILLLGLLVNLLSAAVSFSTVGSFAPIRHQAGIRGEVMFRSSLASTPEPQENPNPVFPAGNTHTPPATNDDEEQGQANTRFSQFAPDPSMETNDFRSQLMDNMKEDLERRRRENPNRGNQPAKSYLDSL